MAEAHMRNELRVMTMNTGKRPGYSGQAADIKKRVIRYSLRENPDLVSFQEFQWGPGQHGLTCLHDKYIKTNYIYIPSTGSKEVGILYNKERVNVQQIQNVQIPMPEIGNIPNAHFDPNSRMCMCQVQINTTRKNFICFAWHGPAYRSGMSNDNKMAYFRTIMTFVHGLHMAHRLPVIIAGDFNLPSNAIIPEVALPFNLHAARDDIIDFHIATQDFQLLHEEIINIKNVNRKRVLDHYPVVANFTL